MTAKERYRELCKKEDTIGIFQKDFWLDAVSGDADWDVLLYEKGDNILGALTYYYEISGRKIRICMPQFTQSMGPWLKYPLRQNRERKISFEIEAMDNLVLQLEKLPLLSYKQSFTIEVSNWLPFYWKSFHQQTYYSYRILDISNIEKVQSEFHSSKKKNIKRALSLNLTVKFDLPPEKFYENHVLTLSKQGEQISYSYELFQKIYHTAYDHHAGRTIYAVDEQGNLHAALFVIWDKKCAYDLISTIDPEYRNSGASTLLVLEMMRYLSGKVQAFDFEGSMIPGVEQSFRRFGATQMPYFTVWKDYGGRAELLMDKICRKIKR